MAVTTSYAIGVDRCKGSWLGVIYEDGNYADVVLVDEIEQLVDTYRDTARRILVDVPIGLLGESECDDDGEFARRCDQLARTVLGSRHSSVFNPPSREAVEAAAFEEYESVAETNKEITGKGLQQQAYHIADCIREVDQLLRNDPGLGVGAEPCVLVESHPEVCFAALADGPMEHSKQSVSGLVERLDAIDRIEDDARGTFDDICDALAADEGSDADVDDVVDAMVLAVTAAGTENELHRLPPDGPPTDAKELPMQMVYRADEPFSQVVE